jgi:hypothetical protein
VKKRSLTLKIIVNVLSIILAISLLELAPVDIAKTNIFSFEQFSIWVFVIFLFCIYTFENMLNWLIDFVMPLEQKI